MKHFELIRSARNCIKQASEELKSYTDVGLIEQIKQLMFDKLKSATFDIGTPSFNIAVEAAFKERYGVSLHNFTSNRQLIAV